MPLASSNTVFGGQTEFEIFENVARCFQTFNCYLMSKDIPPNSITYFISDSWIASATISNNEYIWFYHSTFGQEERGPILPPQFWQSWLELELLQEFCQTNKELHHHNSTRNMCEQHAWITTSSIHKKTLTWLVWFMEQLVEFFLIFRGRPLGADSPPKFCLEVKWWVIFLCYWKFDILFPREIPDSKKEKTNRKKLLKSNLANWNPTYQKLTIGKHWWTYPILITNT